MRRVGRRTQNVCPISQKDRIRDLLLRRTQKKWLVRHVTKCETEGLTCYSERHRINDMLRRSQKCDLVHRITQNVWHVTQKEREYLTCYSEGHRKGDMVLTSQKVWRVTQKDIEGVTSYSDIDKVTCYKGHRKCDTLYRRKKKVCYVTQKDT